MIRSVHKQMKTMLKKISAVLIVAFGIIGGLTHQVEAATPVAATSTASPSQTSATVTGYVNAGGESTSYWFAYGTSSSNLSYQTGRINAGNGNSSTYVSATISNLNPSTTYYYAIESSNNSGNGEGTVKSFTTLASSNTGGGTGGQTGYAPVASTYSASAYQNSATVSGYVNPNGSATSYWFAYGTSSSNLSYQTGRMNAGNGNSSTYVSATISNLNPSTTYYYAIESSNDYGAGEGTVKSFTTQSSYNGGGSGGGDNTISAPTISTGSATNIGTNSATFNGSLTANNDTTTYWFEYRLSGSSNPSQTQPQSVSGSYNSSVAYSVSGLSSYTNYEFRLVARNSKDTRYGSFVGLYTNGVNNPVLTGTNYSGMAPDVNTESATFYGDRVYLNGSVYPRAYSVDVWFAYGTDSNWLPYVAGYRTITNGNYWMGVSEPVTLQAGTTYYYRVIARSSSGTQSGNIVSFTTNGSGAVNIYLKPTLSSVYATNVLRNSAIMRGQINPNGSTTSFWFEYGTTPSPITWTLKGDRTSVGSLNGYSNVSMAVTGLDATTTYYYRVVAQNAYGTSASDVAQFTTKTWLTAIISDNETTPVVTKSNDNSSVIGGSDISLDPSVSKSEVVSGDDVNFNVTYKNSGKAKLSGATIKMTLPDSVEYVGASTSLTTRAGNTLSFYVGDIASGTQGNIAINVKVKSGVKSGDTLMFSTMMEYYDSLKKFQSISSYVTSNVKVQSDNKDDNSNLTGSLSLASVFTSGGLNIILIILVIVTLGYLITSKKKQQ